MTALISVTELPLLRSLYASFHAVDKIHALETDHYVLNTDSKILEAGVLAGRQGGGNV